MSIVQRFAFLKSIELKNMKFMLAYIEQFMGMIIEASEEDLAQTIQKYNRNITICTCLSMVCLALLFVVVPFRWRKLLTHRKLIQSVISLISL